ncbi:SH3 domain-binding glutamic acid-rich-like protein 3, partial [Cyanistes caeruleus]
LFPWVAISLPVGKPNPPGPILGPHLSPNAPLRAGCAPRAAVGAELSLAGTLGVFPSGSSPSPRNLPFPPGFQIKSQQSEVTRILDGKNIKYELVDISQDNALREEMRAKAGNPKAIPPQIVNGDQYCGDYELFVEAVEQNTLQEFLKLA